MGLTAGDRPAADVEVLCSSVAMAEFELARRMEAAARSGSLPLVGTARCWGRAGGPRQRRAGWPGRGRSLPITRNWRRRGVRE